MTAAVAVRQDPPDMPQGKPARRHDEPFDIDELIRRLEAYRLEMKIANVRQKSQQLKDRRSSTLTYQPRYTTRLSSLGPTEISRPFSAVGDRSKRSSRVWENDKSDRSDKSDEDSEKFDSGRSSQWVNPKHVHAMSDGGSGTELEAINTIDLPNPRPEDDEASVLAARKAHRRSFAFLESGIARLKSQSSNHSLRHLRPNSRAAPAAADGPPPPPGQAPPLPTIHLSPPPTLTAVQEAKQNRRRTWRPPPPDSDDWTQTGQTDEPVFRQSPPRTTTTSTDPYPRAPSKVIPSDAFLGSHKQTGLFTSIVGNSTTFDMNLHHQKEKEPAVRKKGFFRLFKRLR